MKVLVVGSGGREHAMAWKLAQSPKVQQVYVAPGNGGTAKDKNLVNVPITDLTVLRQWAIDNGIAYIKRSYQAERDEQGRPKGDAPFSYEPYGGRKTFSTTAAGLLSLQVAGQYDAPEVLGSANWLLTSPPEINEPWFFYGTYYYAQGMYQRGGEHAAIARQKTEQMLVDSQNPDGSWFPRNGNEKSAGAVYATSLALLSLSVYHHFLPIYQK